MWFDVLGNGAGTWTRNRVPKTKVLRVWKLWIVPQFSFTSALSFIHMLALSAALLGQANSAFLIILPDQWVWGPPCNDDDEKLQKYRSSIYICTCAPSEYKRKELFWSLIAKGKLTKGIAARTNHDFLCTLRSLQSNCACKLFAYPLRLNLWLLCSKKSRK